MKTSFFRSQTNHHTVTYTLYTLYLQNFDFVIIFFMKTLSEKHDWRKATIAKSKDFCFVFSLQMWDLKKNAKKQNKIILTWNSSLKKETFAVVSILAVSSFSMNSVVF